jgi:predicted GIY-YIG superfamily endonuclease
MKKDCYVYELRDGHRIVYYGITSNPDSRVVQHENSRKRFTHMNIIRGPMYRENAETLEWEYIQNYQYQH